MLRVWLFPSFSTAVLQTGPPTLCVRRICLVIIAIMMFPVNAYTFNYTRTVTQSQLFEFVFRPDTIIG